MAAASDGGTWVRLQRRRILATMTPSEVSGSRGYGASYGRRNVDRARAGGPRDRGPCASELLGHPVLCRPRRGPVCAARSGHRELVHVRHLGVVHGRPEPAGRGPARVAAPTGRPRRRDDGRGAGSRTAHSKRCPRPSLQPRSCPTTCSMSSASSSARARPTSPTGTPRCSPRSLRRPPPSSRASGADPPDPASARAKVLPACEGTRVRGHQSAAAGFSHWCDAMSEADPARRSQLILAGSLQLGAHEQNHLQDRSPAAWTWG